MSDTSVDPQPTPPATSDGTRGSPLRDFLRGAALIFDFRGSLGQRDISTVRYPSDSDRLAEDWWAVGNGLRRAMGQEPIQRPNPSVREDADLA